jgi:hypothetical protein
MPLIWVGIWIAMWIYGFFAFCAIVSYIYVHFKVPETKGMELEDTDTLGDVDAALKAEKAAAKEK